MKAREREYRGNMRYFGKPISLPQLITTVQMQQYSWLHVRTTNRPSSPTHSSTSVSAAHSRPLLTGGVPLNELVTYVSSFLTTSREADEYQYCLRTLTLEWYVIGLLTFSGMFQRRCFFYYRVHKKTSFKESLIIKIYKQPTSML